MSYPPTPDRPILFLDYDGTLAPIVDDPAKAFPHPAVPEILEQLLVRFPVWIVTGRDIETLSRFLSVPVQAIGIHGMEQGSIGGESLSIDIGEAQDDLEAMRKRLPDLAAVYVEDKNNSFAVHFRDVDDPERVMTILNEWSETAPKSLIPIFGKCVVELRPANVSKGHAVTRIMQDYPTYTPVYIGDDQTDEDAFAMLPTSAVTIKVGSGNTQARYHLEHVDDVVVWLRRLLDQNTRD